MHGFRERRGRAARPRAHRHPLHRLRRRRLGARARPVVLRASRDRGATASEPRASAAGAASSACRSATPRCGRRRRRPHRVRADRGGVIDARIEVAARARLARRSGCRSTAATRSRPPCFIVDPAVRVRHRLRHRRHRHGHRAPPPASSPRGTPSCSTSTPARRSPGMAVLYERLHRSHPAPRSIYLSTGAWNVAPTLSRFLSRNLYPRGPAAAHRLGADARPLVPQQH